MGMLIYHTIGIAPNQFYWVYFRKNFSKISRRHRSNSRLVGVRFHRPKRGRVFSLCLLTFHLEGFHEVFNSHPFATGALSGIDLTIEGDMPECLRAVPTEGREDMALSIATVDHIGGGAGSKAQAVEPVESPQKLAKLRRGDL